MKKLKFKGLNLKLNKVKLKTYEMSIIFLSFALVLLVYYFSKNILYALGIFILALFLICSIRFFNGRKRIGDSKGDYIAFYDEFFNVLDINHDVKSSLRLALNNVLGTPLASKVEQYLQQYSVDNKIKPSFQYFNSIEETDYLLYLKKGLDKAKVNSGYIDNLYKFYKNIYLDEKNRFDLSLFYIVFMSLAYILALI